MSENKYLRTIVKALMIRRAMIFVLFGYPRFLLCVIIS